jgi:hypothetical protein
MLTVKEAVRAAEQWVRDLYPQQELEHLRLEEVTLSDDELYWRITLGWVEPAVQVPVFSSALGGRDIHVLPRVYKTLEVDAETGDVKSMKIREVA